MSFTALAIRSSARCLSIVIAATVLSSCTSVADNKAAADAAAKPIAPSGPPVAAAPAPLPTLPYDEAVLSAANSLLTKAQLPPGEGGKAARYSVVIDPLIDGMTGMQSKSTQGMGDRIVGLIRDKYPQYEVLPFTSANIGKANLVLVGTLTGVDKDRKTAGMREAFRICLALADLKAGKLVGKGLAFAQPANVDSTPTPFFQDAPAWTEDPSTLGYIRTCQGTVAGDPINALYIDRIQAAVVISEAINAYDAGRYADALNLYENALRIPFGNQFRVFSGLYLTNWKLRRKEAATGAFAQLVDFGLEHKQLGVKFLFQPGKTAFVADRKLNEPYPIWLSQIAARSAQKNACLAIVGHTSPTGAEPANEKLSLQRAESIKTQLSRGAPALGKRLTATGVGSRDSLVGNGKDDATDALDRRVEFRMATC